MKKTVLIDASSAILLYKAGWMMPLMENYRVGTGPAAFREMTVANYPGAISFSHWQQQARIALHTCGVPLADRPANLQRLGPGERECIELYYQGAGDFILVDDGPAAAFCRREAIPYINALLVPRLLSPGADSRHPDVATAMQHINVTGRYARWIWDYARSCPPEDLAFFLP